MATALRIYTVRTKTGGKLRLIKAPNAPQAIRHAAADTFTATVATQDELVAAVAAGTKVETTGDAALRDAAAGDQQQEIPS